jgi:hypothetical protein
LAEDTTQTTTENTETDAQKLARENAELRAALNAATSRADTAERGQSEAQRGQLTEAQRRIQAELNGCKGQIEALDGEADTLESQIAALSDEPGHGKEVAALNRKLADNAAERRDLKNREVYFNNQFERAKTEAAAPVGKILANGQPLSNFDPAAQAWLEAHPQAFTDRAYFNRVIAAAQSAVNLEGFAQNSPEFFEYIEGKADSNGRQPLRQTARVAAAGEEEESPLSDVTPQADDLYTVKKPQAPAAGRGAMSTVAAPSRSIPGNTNAGGRRVPALSAEEKSVADDLYGELVPIERYKKYAEGKAYMANRPSTNFKN